VALRILIVRTSAIGDVVVTTPVARALREALPDAYLAWLVEPRAREVLEGNPHLDEVIVWDRRKGSLRPADLWRLRRLLRPHRIDTAIDFQGLLRSALAARISGARTIIGNVKAKESADLLYTERVPRRSDDLSSRQRCLDLLRPLGIESADRRMEFPVSDVTRAEVARLLREEGVTPEVPYVSLVPGTTWPQKHWQEGSWAELASVLHEERGLRPVLLGGPADRGMAERIAASSGVPCVNLAGRTSLRQAGAVLAGGGLTVAVDTGLMHISVAVGTPTVGICGASWWRGFQDYARFALVREPMACSPCLRNPTCDGRFDCMRAVTAAGVLFAAHRLLDGESLSSPRSTPLPVLR
jgi:heptosyltransferase I